MKKLLAIALALMLCLPALALAEEPLEIEITFDGVWFPFADHGFQLYVPADWAHMDMLMFTDPESFEFAGYQIPPVLYYMFSDESFSTMFNVLVFSTEDLPIEEFQTKLEAEYADVGNWVTINEIPFFLFENDAESNTSGAVTLAEGAAYAFLMIPADDEAFSELAMQVIASIQPIAE